MNSPHSFRVLLPLLSAFLLAISAARSEVVVTDSFTDGGFTNGSDALDIAWYGVKAPAGNLSVVNDTALGSGNALRFDAGGTLNRGVVGTLAKPVTLEDGESVKLSFRFRFENTTNLNFPSRLRWGFYDSGGTPIEQHNATWILFSNDEGYFAGTHGASASSTGTSLAQERGAQDEPTLGGGIHGQAYASDLNLVYGASVSLSTTVHTAELTITRNGSALSVTARVDGLAAASLTDVWPTSFYFDQVVITFGTASAPGPIRIDDVVVEHTPKGVSDGFTDGAITDNATDGRDTAWYSMGVGGSALTVVNDTGIGAGNALQFTPSGTGNQGFVGRLPAPISLADGGSVSLRFQYRFTGTTGLNLAGRLRFGLYNAGATFTSSHNQGTVRNNDKGYYGQTNPGATGSSATSVARETNSDEILGATGVTTIGTAGSSVNAGTTAHTGLLSIRRSGTALILTASIDGQPVATATDNSPLTYDFDEVAIGIGQGSPTASPLRVDNIAVSTAPAFPVGDGTYENPIAGPAPSVSSSLIGSGFRLVKNWDFGTNGNIRSINELAAHFRFYDPQYQYNTGAGKYGAHTLAPHALTAIANQPVEGAITNGQVARQMMPDWLRGFIVPFAGVTVLNPQTHNCGSACFYAKWRLLRGGSLLGREIVWETQVRYVTPRYFYTALWTTVTTWQLGAEMDVMESFGFSEPSLDNTTGRFWHVNSVGGTDLVNYTNWDQAMAGRGITNYDATQPHTWTWHYKTDNTYSVYMDGILVQWGSINWTTGATPAGTPQDMSFLYDGGWGHTQVPQLSTKTLPVAELAGKYYEWNYSRVYLK